MRSNQKGGGDGVGGSGGDEPRPGSMDVDDELMAAFAEHRLPEAMEAGLLKHLVTDDSDRGILRVLTAGARRPILRWVGVGVGVGLAIAACLTLFLVLRPSGPDPRHVPEARPSMPIPRGPNPEVSKPPVPRRRGRLTFTPAVRERLLRSREFLTAGKRLMEEFRKHNPEFLANPPTPLERGTETVTCPAWPRGRLTAVAPGFRPVPGSARIVIQDAGGDTVARVTVLDAGRPVSIKAGLLKPGERYQWFAESAAGARLSDVVPILIAPQVERDRVEELRARIERASPEGYREAVLAEFAIEWGHYGVARKAVQRRLSAEPDDVLARALASRLQRLGVMRL